jgi:very-short-patch-repair endonuclease
MSFEDWSSDQRSLYAIKGWAVRRENGNDFPPWNKGKTAETDPKIAKMTKKLRATFRKLKRQGKIKAWNKGKKLSKKHCENLSLAHMGQVCTQETKEKMSKTRKGRKHSKAWGRAISRGLKRSEKMIAARRKFLPKVFSSVSKHPNGLEQRMIEILKGLKIKYRFQVWVGPYFPDFLIPKSKLLIEVDGSYWHRNKARDRKRDRDLRKLGYRVVHFKERDVKHNPKVVADKVISLLEK